MRNGRSTRLVLAIAVGLLLTAVLPAAVFPRLSSTRAADEPTSLLQTFELSPGYDLLVGPGDVVEYIHVLTNTGATTASFSAVAVASEDWTLQYTNASYPGGTALLLPFPLTAGQAITLGLKLWVPSSVEAPLVNTTTLTVTSISLMQSAVAYDRAIVESHNIYLPIALRYYPNTIYLVNGDFSAGLTGWTVLGSLGVSSATDPSSPYGPVALLGDPHYPCAGGVPIATGGIRQTFTVPAAATGVSAHLRFRYRIFTNDKNANLLDVWDSFDVYVGSERKFRDANRTLFNYCNVPPYDLGWKYADVLLGAGGTALTFTFEVANRGDNYYNTYVYVDDIRIAYIQ